MSRSLHAKWSKLLDVLRGQSRWLIAFSGGCDSTLLLAAARDAVGAENVLAVTAVSASLATEEKALTERLADQLQVPHRFTFTNELSNPSYAANPPNRCFFCKDELFTHLAPLAEQHQMVIGDGFNASDRADYRPGFQAAEKWNVRHPLNDADLFKPELRALSRWKKLSTWNKPASPCLSSRIPYGKPVTVHALRQIEEAEKFLRAEGFSIVRVRHYDTRARIEVPLSDLSRLQKRTQWTRITIALQAIGFSTVEVDPRGFQSGRLNENIVSFR